MPLTQTGKTTNDPRYEEKSAWFQHRKARGLCPSCGEPYDGKFYRCQKCKRKQSEYDIKRGHQRRHGACS